MGRSLKLVQLIIGYIEIASVVSRDNIRGINSRRRDKAGTSINTCERLTFMGIRLLAGGRRGFEAVCTFSIVRMMRLALQ